MKTKQEQAIRYDENLKAMYAAGFVLVGTGGGCVAWTPRDAYDMADESIPELLVTSCEGPYLPAPDDPWTATLDGEPIASGDHWDLDSVFAVHKLAIEIHLI